MRRDDVFDKDNLRNNFKDNDFTQKSKSKISKVNSEEI